MPEYLIPDSSCWQRDLPDGHLTVIVANEYGLVHLSISHRRNTVNGTKPGRYPTWAEIKDVRDTFTPEDVTMAMLLPPSAEYVNLHATTFHLWELRPDQVPGD